MGGMTTVRMRAARTWQDVGIERRLEVGQVCDLPDNVASALIATGVAVAMPVAVPLPASEPHEFAVEPPIETKPVRSFERTRRGA